MTRRPPADRPLPNPDQVLDRIRAAVPAAQPSARRRTGWLVPAIAAVAVAVIAAAVLVVPTLSARDTGTTGAAAQPSEIDLDLGPLSPAEIATFLKHCWFWNGTMQKVVHTTKVKSARGDGVEWSLAMIGHRVGGNGVKPGDNSLTGCSGRPHGKTDGTPDQQGFRLENFITQETPWRYDDSFRPQDPIQLDNSDGIASTSTWIRVPAGVARVRQRLVNPAQTSPWFATKPVDGIAYVQGWLKSVPKPADTRVETQFLNAAGDLIEIPGSNGPTSTSKVMVFESK